MRLSELRKKKNITQQKLADHLRVSRSAVAMWETGASEPDNKTLDSIANYFDVSVDYLLGRSDSIKDEEGGIDHLLNDDRVHVRAYGGDGTEYVFSPEKWDAVKQILDAMADKKENP